MAFQCLLPCFKVKVKGQGQMSRSKVKVKCLAHSVRYLGSACRVQQKHYDTWNSVQDLCVFVSNQGAFTIKSLPQRRSITFNFLSIITSFPSQNLGFFHFTIKEAVLLFILRCPCPPLHALCSTLSLKRSFTVTPSFLDVMTLQNLLRTDYLIALELF